MERRTRSGRILRPSGRDRQLNGKKTTGAPSLGAMRHEIAAALERKYLADHDAENILLRQKDSRRSVSISVATGPLIGFQKGGWLILDDICCSIGLVSNGESAPCEPNFGGHVSRGTGILNNESYIGRMV